MFALGTLFYLGLMLLNAVAVLHEQRFLSKIGWSIEQLSGFHDANQEVKLRIIHLISAIRMLLRIPLIFVNSMVIIYEIILG
ncbi:Yos1-like protein [Dimargaris cristalligena]|uniref:Yos1-like protein n=1 Tax=Dimargaris cristalligena TaxID=215637 RepID=A0A4Q0A2T8_9FUNG|nr:Yos1-like protein [Dimargaris cristalligena]|eukprot:RKP40435.1 Yos1-like protein [Dimargaris cristalligena]